MRLIFLLLTVSLVLTGCDSSSDNNFVVTPSTGNGNGVLPQLTNDNYTTLGNAQVNFPVASGVFNNDSLQGGTLDGFDAVSSQNATVNIKADGSFSYSPVFGFTGTDTFTYTVSNTAGSSTATVTVQVPEPAYFVSNSGNNGNGSLTSPFNNIASAVAAANENDVLFIFRGDGTATGLDTPITLQNGQSLVGEATGLAVDGTIVAPGQRPNTTLQVTLANNNRVSGLAFSKAGGGNIITGDEFSSPTITDNFFNNEASRAILLEDVTGTAEITDNRFIALASAANGLRVVQTVAINPTGTFNVNSNRFQTSNAPILARVANPATAGDTGIDFQILGGTTTINANQNAMEAVNTSSEWQGFLDLSVDGSAQCTATLNGNTLSAIDNNAIEVNALTNSSLRLNVSQNTGTGIDSDAFCLNSQDAATLVCVLNTNNFSVQDEGVNADSSDTSNLRIRLTGNILTSVGSASVSLRSSTTSSACLDATGNTLAQGFELTQTNTSTFQVEQFNTLSALNNGAGVTPNGTIADVADNTCQF